MKPATPPPLRVTACTCQVGKIDPRCPYHRRPTPAHAGHLTGVVTAHEDRPRETR